MAGIALRTMGGMRSGGSGLRPAAIFCVPRLQIAIEAFRPADVRHCF